MDIWIGTSGYSYADWVGDFYPAGLRSEKMLSYYCRFFPLVELNFTFYRPPTRDVLARMADKTPAEFQFLVKLPQSLSHEQSSRDLNSFREAVTELQGRNQLAGLLCQLPQAAHLERKSIRWLQTLGRELEGLRLAVEFRHRSWSHPELLDWMAKHHIDLVAVDVPDLPALFPRGWVQSSRRAYVRLHSRHSGNWYLSEKERYDYTYSDRALSEWVKSMRSAEDRTDEVLFLFNNCYRGQAVVNARRLRALIEEQAPEVSVIRPFAPTPPVQRSLFE